MNYDHYTLICIVQRMVDKTNVNELTLTELKHHLRYVLDLMRRRFGTVVYSQDIPKEGNKAYAQAVRGFLAVQFSLDYYVGHRVTGSIGGHRKHRGVKIEPRHLWKNCVGK